jgi:hypothetical protein
MTPRSIAALLMTAGLALTACQQGSAGRSDATHTPTPTVAVDIPAPTPATTGGSPVPEPAGTKGIVPAPETDKCGADKLGPYLNLLPTSTAKEEIAKTVGHNRVRYVGPDDVTTREFREDRLTARLGVDGRIKSFGCG